MSTILVVDDMAICREPIADALERHGYDVVCAADGTEALSVMLERRPDLVLLDVNMPRLDGLAVLRTIRRNPNLNATPVILLTDKADKECVVEAAALGVQGYILKSNFSLDELLERTSSCLRKPGAVATATSAAATTHTAAKSASRPAYAQWRAKTEKSTTAAPRPVSKDTPTSDTTPAARPTGACRVETQNTAHALSTLSPVITKVELVRLVNKGLELRPLGPAVHNLMAVTGSAGCSSEDVAKAVTQDQVLSIRILKLANSSAYSRGRPVDGVKDAVQRIGVQEVRSMVMTLGVLQQYEGGVGEHIDPRMFWEHSIACGLIASALGKELRISKGEDCFLWGMVHDVGRLILLDHVPEQYAKVWTTARELGLPLESVEAKMMLQDHCHILERALEHWQFLRDFITPVVSHHQTPQGIKRLGPQHCDAAATVALGNRLAHALMLGNSGDEMIYPFDELAELLKLKPQFIEQLTEIIPQETDNLKFTMLARSNDEIWPDFAAQVREKLHTHLRPLCISAEPAFDAYRILCQRIAGAADEGPPNLGVVYLREVGEQNLMGIKFEAEEKAYGPLRVPVIVICKKGKVDVEQSWLASRRCVVLPAPVRLSSLINAINELLEGTTPELLVG